VTFLSSKTGNEETLRHGQRYGYEVAPKDFEFEPEAVREKLD